MCVRKLNSRPQTGCPDDQLAVVLPPIDALTCFAPADAAAEMDATMSFAEAEKSEGTRRPERTKCAESTDKRTKVEHHAALRRSSGIALSGRNPSLFSDAFRVAPQI